MIRSKAEWYGIFNGPQFNRTENFSIAEFMKIHDRYPDGKIFCFRNPTVPGGRFVCMTKAEAVEKIRSGEFRDPYNVAERAPNDHIVVQGEYDGVCAEISFLKTPIRFALKKERIHISRVQLIGLIGYERYRYIDDVHQQFYEGNDLNDRPVVEFSVYDCGVGKYHKDIIIWEIRNY